MNRRTLANAMLIVWLWSFPVALAMAGSFKDDMRDYDLESLGWAALMSLFGGALRTIFTLAADTAIVRSVPRELTKDAAVAIIAGVICYIAVEAVRSAWFPSIPSELRFAIIVFAGWSRMSFFGALNDLGSKATDAVTARIVGAIGDNTATPVSPPEEKGKPFQEKP